MPLAIGNTGCNNDLGPVQAIALKLENPYIYQVINQSALHGQVFGQSIQVSVIPGIDGGRAGLQAKISRLYIHKEWVLMEQRIARHDIGTQRIRQAMEQIGPGRT